MASAILTTRNGPRSTDFDHFTSNYTNNGNLSFNRLQNFSNPNPSPNSSRFFAGNTSRDAIWSNHQQLPHYAPPQAAFTGSPFNSVPTNTCGYRYITFRLGSYTRRELRDLKKVLMSDLQRVRILRQWLYSASPMPKKSYHPPLLQLPAPPEAFHATTAPQRSTVSQKRALPLPPARDTKKQCGRTTNAQRTKTMMRECGQILGKLMRHKHGWVFNNPVDTAGLKLHDYHHIISNPMDLGTIKSKLTKNQYDSPISFASDVRLTFQNAMVYNGKDSNVFDMAERLLSLFEDMFDSMRQKLVANEMKKENRAAKVRNVTVVEETPVVPQVNLGMTMVRVSNKPVMTEEEKSELAASFWNLNIGPEGMNQIMDILKKGVSGLQQEGNEIELDLGVLDNDTLWALHAFISRTRKELVSNLISSVPTNRPTNYSAGNGNGHVFEQGEECRNGEGGEEYIDIGEEIHSTVFPSIVIERDTVNVSSSSDSSSDSDSSSSGGSGESGTFGGNSDNEQEVNSTPKMVAP